MAKRKRLNKKLILILSGVLVLMLLGTGLFAHRYGLHLKLFPKDPEKYTQLGDDARARGDYREAERCYAIARYYSKDLRHDYKLAEFQFEWWKDPTGLSETERRDRFGSARKVLNDALLIDPDHKECLRLLCEMEWLRASFTRRWEDYIGPATRLVQLEKEDHATHYRLGVAKGSLAQTDYNYADPAEESFRTAIKLKPDEINYWIGLSQFHFLMRKNSELAQEVFEEALKANPDSAALRISYASFLRVSDKEKSLQQIKEAIGLLSGNMRQYIRGRDRLLVSGEYAVPPLLRKLDNPETSMVLRERIMTVLPKFGKAAVPPRDGTTGWYYSTTTSMLSANSTVGAESLDPRRALIEVEVDPATPVHP